MRLPHPPNLHRISVLVSCLFACACGPTESTDAIFVSSVRLFDTSAPTPAAAQSFYATLVGDTRPVLRDYSPSMLSMQTGAPSPSGRVAVRKRLPERYARTSQLVLQPWIQRAGTGWSRLDPQYVAVEQDAKGAYVESMLQLPKAAGTDEPGTAIKVRARVSVPGTEKRQRIRTQDVTVPSGARLGFGFGILQEAWSQGPVAFSVRVCRAADCTVAFDDRIDPGGEPRDWRDHSIALDEYAGATVAIEFETEHLAATAFTLPVWSNPTVYAPDADAPERPNVVLVSLDTLRADRLTSYGYSRDTSPCMEARLARGGVTVAHAISSAPLTTPSHMTLFTGLPPSAHGLTDNGARSLRNGIRTLAEVLRASGYETGAVTDDGGVSARRGFRRGFNSYIENMAPSGDIESTLSRARAWLEQHHRRRFFLFVHSYQTHGPYGAPDEYDRYFTTPSPNSHPPIPERWDPDRYDRGIRYTDDELCSFFDELEREGFLDDTVIVVTSDHGDGFLEHGYLDHGAGIHEELLHVPLFFAGPGIPAGHRIERPVGLIDLMPTILELVGVPPVPESMGRSFAGLVRGEPADGSWDSHPIFSESWSKWLLKLDDEGRPFFETVPQPTFSVRVGSRKLTRYRRKGGHRYTYHDIASDPEESIDLYSDDPEAAADLRALLDRYAAATRAPPGRPGEQHPAETLDPANETMLRALGYLREPEGE